MNTEVPIRRGIKSFVLRAGRMGPGQQRALAELGPRFCVAIDAESVDPAALDLPALFGNTHPVTLEIGFGMGETTAQIAAAHPQRNFLGAEVHIAGVGALLKRIGEQGLGNIRIVRHDAVDLLERRIAPDSLAGAHVFFPDPWHKKRHHKRRLIQPDFVRLLASRITPNGYVHCATDWHEYAEQMLSVLSAEPTLRNAYDGYAPRPDYRPLTKFERRGLRLGHGVWDLIFRRRDASPAD